jgi:hypothetical protein
VFRIDLNTPEFLANPYPVYTKLREAGPVFPLMPGLWLITRHEEADRILRDPRLGRAFLIGIERRYGAEAVHEPAFQIANRFMLLMNPPEHTRLRALVSKAFSVKQAPELWRLARREALALVDGFIQQGEADLLAEFAYPLPVRVICALLNIQLDDSLMFQRETQALTKIFELSPISQADIDAANHAAAVFDDYFRALCRERRRQPGNDLVSLLLQAEEGNHRLNEDEVVANIILLFMAGHETTANMLGNTLLTLFRHPEQLALLYADPALLPQAINEALRYDTSVQIAARTAMEDLDIAGTPIQRGDMVYISLGAANRDPAAFPAPDAFLIQRPESSRKPLSFGGGAHYCLGARLARIELETALDVLFMKMPGLRLLDVEQPRWRPTLTIRGLETLRAVW